MVPQLGIPTWFLALSAADMQWHWWSLLGFAHKSSSFVTQLSEKKNRHKGRSAHSTRVGQKVAEGGWWVSIDAWLKAGYTQLPYFIIFIIIFEWWEKLGYLEKTHICKGTTNKTERLSGFGLRIFLLHSNTATGPQCSPF
ncbi:hypothetical protein ATANTOWER_013728 [Ataeniobius toweri]|uniref:Uncharacterized protein n=1 Tax=Ataeniobius toweri TaxID=208326 RepID=A0ABU7ARE0_9TELE|nr:hypothetical protein [Ataeniobius toweri]